MNAGAYGHEIKDALVRAVRGGQLRGGSGTGGRVSESDLVGMLEELGSAEAKRQTRIVFQRRRMDDEDDDD